MSVAKLPPNGRSIMGYGAAKSKPGVQERMPIISGSHKSEDVPNESWRSLRERLSRRRLFPLQKLPDRD